MLYVLCLLFNDINELKSKEILLWYQDIYEWLIVECNFNFSFKSGVERMSQLCEKHPNHFLWILNCSAFLSNLLGSFVNKVAFCFGYIVSILYWACNKLATSVLCSTSSILQYLYILLNFIIYKGSLKTNGNTVYGVAWIIYTGIIDNIHVWP